MTPSRSLLADPAAVADQYRDSSNLDARTRIYALYETSVERWPACLYERLSPSAEQRWLDVGCGAAGVWAAQAERLPAGLRLVLADRSPGMLEEARRRLAGTSAEVSSRQADVASLPFEDGAFDAVLCSHVLYHVAERGKALGELRRVLRPGGRAWIATNDWTHLQEVRELVQRFAPDAGFMHVGRDPAHFDLETAAEEVEASFGSVRVHRRRSSLEVTDVAPLVDYVRSMFFVKTTGPDAIAALEAHAARLIEREGSFHVTTSAGVVEAER